MFSRSCHYALQAVLYITLHGGKGKAVKIKDISESQDIPVHFLGKILQILVKHKVLASIKGPNGGFIMGVNSKDISLFEIVGIIDGHDIFDQCGIGFKSCSDEHPCPVHNEFKDVKAKIKTLLESKTIAELCEDVKNGKSVVSFAQA
ncbi:MAG: Rrf2 family transcriptional regulator [Saprospiraceae bacterium]|nr:Rrf2 family transcriptional regulator [Saprospiraceae bacterium]